MLNFGKGKYDSHYYIYKHKEIKWLAQTHLALLLLESRLEHWLPNFQFSAFSAIST